MVLHFERVGVRVAFWLVGSAASMSTIFNTFSLLLPSNPLLCFVIPQFAFT